MTTQERIKSLREEQELSQEWLAEAMNCSLSSVQRSEALVRKFSNAEIQKALSKLGLAGYPITEDELKTFENRLFIFRDTIRDGNYEKAQEDSKELDVITKSKLEPELATLYVTFLARLLLNLGKRSEAREKLETFGIGISEHSVKLRYYFYHSFGILCIHEETYEKALEYLLMADETGIDEEEVLQKHNLGLCYSRLGKYAVALITYERMYTKMSSGLSDKTAANVNNSIGASYLRLEHYDEAEKFLCVALERATAISHTTLIGWSLHNLGTLHYKREQFRDGIKLFEQASKYFDEDSSDFLENLYFKLLCMIKDKHPQRKASVEKAIELAKDKEYYSMLFNGLQHMFTIKNQSSKDFIVEQVLPSIKSRHDYFKTFEFFDVVEKSYLKSRFKYDDIKALEIRSEAFEIYKIMTTGRN